MISANSENGVESSHNNLNFEESRYSMRSRRRRIYDDGDFKQVVKNFYSVIASLNKGKKIQKTQKQKPQIREKQEPNPKTQMIIDSQQTQPLQPQTRLRLNSTHISIAYWTYIAKNNLYNVQPSKNDKDKSLNKLLFEYEEEKE